MPMNEHNSLNDIGPTSITGFLLRMLLIGGSSPTNEYYVRLGVVSSINHLITTWVD